MTEEIPGRGWYNRLVAGGPLAERVRAYTQAMADAERVRAEETTARIRAMLEAGGLRLDAWQEDVLRASAATHSAPVSIDVPRRRGYAGGFDFDVAPEPRIRAGDRIRIRSTVDVNAEWEVIGTVGEGGLLSVDRDYAAEVLGNWVMPEPQTFQTSVSYTVTGEEVLENIRRIRDLMEGRRPLDRERVETVAAAVEAQGRVLLEDVDQLRAAGFDNWTYLQDLLIEWGGVRQVDPPALLCARGGEAIRIAAAAPPGVRLHRDEFVATEAPSLRSVDELVADIDRVLEADGDRPRRGSPREKGEPWPMTSF